MQHFALAVSDVKIRDSQHDVRLIGLVAEIDFDDFRVVLDLFHRAFRQDLALMQNRDPVGDVLDEFHVVLDDQHGPILDDAVEQFGGLDALADAHARHGFVEHQQVRVLDQQHADLEPLLLAVAEFGSRGVEAVLEEDHLGDFLDTILHDLVALEGERAEYGAAAWIGDLEVLEHREILEYRWRLEFAANAGLHDLILPELGQLLAAKLDRAGGRFGLAADQVEHRGLAGAIGTDDDADLVLLDIEREVVHRLEAVEGDGERFDR